MEKKIWTFHHYATPPSMSGLCRPYDFTRQLSKCGYENFTFSSAYLHYSNENILTNKDLFIEHNENNIPFIFVKTSPYNNNGISRIINMCNFFKNLFPVTKAYSKKQGKPNLIIASSPHPLTMIAGIFIAKRYKIPCICEIRDLWPDCIFECGILKKNGIIGRLLLLGEKWIYKKADGIIFTMPGGYEYILEQKWQNVIKKDKCFYINNGVDIETFDYNRENFKIEDEDLENDNIFKVVYTGSIRRANNVETLVEVAKELRENKKIKILVWGGGSELEELKNQSAINGLTNIVFKAFVNKRYIPYILSKSDLNILHYRNEFTFRFGTSQNKNFEYLASGKPVLNTVKITHDIVVEANAGINIEHQTVENIKNAIIDMYNIYSGQMEVYNTMCKNARNLAEEYDFEMLTNKLINIIKKYT